MGLHAEVMEAGGEPREKLRYQRTAGLTEDLMIAFSLATLVEGSEVGVESEAPVLALGLTMGGTTLLADGLWSYPFSFKVIGVRMPDGASEAQASAFATEIAPLANVSGVFDVDDRGVTRRADVKVPPGVSPRLLALLGNIRTSLISVPLPEEAVGVGARWTVERLHQVGAIQTRQRVVYSLLERQGRVLRVGVTLQQSAAPQEVTFDPETSLQVEAYEVSGAGSLLMNLDGITPLSEIRGTSELRGTLRQGQQSLPMRATGAVEVIVTPVADGAAG